MRKVLENNIQERYQYRIEFSDFTEDYVSVRLNNYSNKSLDFYAQVNDQHLKNRKIKSYCPVLADLIDLATAIYITDRVCKQNSNYGRQIKVILPVRQVEVFSNTVSIEKLSTLLYWTTATKWIFEFKRRIKPDRTVSKIQNIEFPTDRPREVALWSGGLDALAGLYTISHDKPHSDFSIVGGGSNDNTFSNQIDLYKRLPDTIKNRTSLFQIPVRLLDTTSVNKNRLMRSRGLVFIIIGSVVAKLEGQNILNIYENGVGALNLPYSNSSVGIDHSRSVHPVTLSKASIFLSDILKEDFKVVNPFLYSTKSNMLRYLYRDDQVELVKKSKSCDKPHREVLSQCGYCSSCLLRRLSIKSVGFNDDSQYLVMNPKDATGESANYFNLMTHQSSSIAELLESYDSHELTWKKFNKCFPSVDTVVSLQHKLENVEGAIIERKIIDLYRNYVEEWNNFSFSS